MPAEFPVTGVTITNEVEVKNDTGNPVPVSSSTLATSAKQDTGNTSLATIAGKDFATQTTLAAILAKLIAGPSTEATLAAFEGANHTDLTQLHTDIATTLIAKEEQIRALLAGTLLVESKPSQITASTSDGAGKLLTYTEVLADSTTINWTVTYHADGSVATQTH